MSDSRDDTAVRSATLAWRGVPVVELESAKHWLHRATCTPILTIDHQPYPDKVAPWRRR